MGAQLDIMRHRGARGEEEEEEGEEGEEGREKTEGGGAGIHVVGAKMVSGGVVE